ncbi:hypothetical protein KCG44_05750 [Pacificimonas sp. WHA3]|uniref:Uncharacterized protein n=1 Tax=Pacificimonas pallii TaxID=2827236 RepID=A0ABS6SD04_9SPHN|nr:hypothetical protein [Pacificimonas pallii]MBV7256287.1 hypothetical protein [Pacificimonas pallii]
MIRMTFRIFLGTMAVLFFLGANLLSSAPLVAPTDVPRAADVGAARALAVKMYWAMRQDRRVSVGVTRDEISGAARLLGHGAPGLRVDAGIRGERLNADASYRLASRTWLNISTSTGAAPADGAARINARIGNIPLTPFLSQMAANLILHGIWREDTPAPRLETMIQGMRILPHAVVGKLDVPLELTRAVRGLAGARDPQVLTAARETLAELSAFDIGLGKPVPLATVYARAFSGPARNVDIASGRSIGVAAAIVGTPVMRLADSNMIRTGGDRMSPLPARLAGRRDLAMHFSLSAALASGNSKLGEALGEWKELDDSLPGGSGFSFVDLAADRAGTRLGEALADPARTARAQGLLARAKPGDLFPMAALGLTEGISDAEFESRFGKLDSGQYKNAVARIDAELDRLPLYRR